MLRLVGLTLHRLVLAVHTLAVVPALQSRLIALAVFLHAVRLLTVAALNVLLLLDLAGERVRVAVHQG